MDGTIVVFGGTGHYGQHITASLTARQVDVRVVSRDPERARGILGDHVHILQGDITSPDSVKEALNGASAIVIAVSAMTPGQIRQARQVERDAVLSLLQMAQSTGVTRVVYLSIFEYRLEVVQKTNAVFRELTEYKLEVEQALAKSGFNWTVLGAPPSYELFFALQRGDMLVVPGGGPPALPCISPLDVGEIAAQTVLRQDLAGQRLRMVGPELLSFPDVAKRLSVYSGRHIRYRPIPLLPVRIASLLALPFTPYLRFLLGSLTLMNAFPPDLAETTPADFQRLQNTFDYVPTTLEMEAERRQFV